MKSRPIGVLQHNQAGLQELTLVINWTKSCDALTDCARVTGKPYLTD
jgi:hypothetical protein